MAPLSPMVGDVLELDNIGGAGHRHIPAAAGVRLLWRPVNPGKWDLPVPDPIPKTLFAKTAAHFAKTATPSSPQARQGFNPPKANSFWLYREIIEEENLPNILINKQIKMVFVKEPIAKPVGLLKRRKDKLKKCKTHSISIFYDASTTIFAGTFSKHRPSWPMLSISRFVCPSVCLFTFWGTV